jgi:alpha-glucosidase
MKFQVWCALFGLFFGYTLAVEWYETASFYQIYPQSFFDDGTGRKGFGSLKGIQSKLPYLKNLGIDCIWLNPIFESKSFRAFGYDITNYKEIDPRYGSISDFDALVKAVHDQNMKIIVDFVPNHCAFDNPLFSDSTKNVNGKDDWFVWTKTAKISDTVVPPSNWKTIDGKNTAWISMDNKTKIKADDVSKEEMAFYYAQFGQSMPDFNLRKAEVVAYLEEVMKFWLDKGVDGFRIDAVSHFFEALPDSTTNKYENEPTNDAKPGELLHTKTQDLDETFQLIYKWRKFLDDYSTNTKTDKK